MINLAAAAVLVRDLTEQHLAGASGRGPDGRDRPTPPNGGAPAGQSRHARQLGRTASHQRGTRGLSQPGRAGRQMPRSA